MEYSLDYFFFPNMYVLLIKKGLFEESIITCCSSRSAINLWDNSSVAEESSSNPVRQSKLVLVCDTPLHTLTMRSPTEVITSECGHWSCTVLISTSKYGHGRCLSFWTRRKKLHPHLLSLICQKKFRTINSVYFLKLSRDKHWRFAAQSKANLHLWLLNKLCFRSKHQKN